MPVSALAGGLVRNMMLLRRVPGRIRQRLSQVHRVLRVQRRVLAMELALQGERRQQEAREQ